MQFGINQSVPRTEDPRLLVGGGCYADDFNFDHQCHAVMVRSPHAHADILSIDASAALEQPGVLAVLTGEDYAADGLGFINGPSPHKRADGSPMVRPPRPALSSDRARYVGQPVAVVIAGLTGAFVGSNVWGLVTAVPPDLHWAGGAMGFIVLALTSLMLFRVVIVLFTSFGGAAMMVLGSITLMLHVPDWQGAVQDTLTNNRMLLPSMLLLATVTGFVIQESRNRAAASSAEE